MLAKTVPGEELGTRQQKNEIKNLYVSESLNLSDPNPSGQLAAVNAVIEALVPTIANPLYSLVYEKTFDTDFPGAAFLLTVAVMIVCIVAFT